MRELFIKGVATGLFSGYMQPFPGTWGTIPAWLIAFFLIGDNPAILVVVTIVTFFISVWFAGQAENLLGHDARKIVIDEWAGMFVALLFVPFSLGTYVLAFFVFRLYDVVKPAPTAQLEQLPRGWGVTMDDIAAGIYANITVRLLILASEHFIDYSFV